MTKEIYSNTDDRKISWLQGRQVPLMFSDSGTVDEQQQENVFLNSTKQKFEATRRQPIDKELIDANMFSQCLKVRAVIIKQKKFETNREYGSNRSETHWSFFFHLLHQQSFH